VCSRQAIIDQAEALGQDERRQWAEAELEKTRLPEMVGDELLRCDINQ
jgi:hypothetical protein